jgi:N-methylhydantoinase A/oxoprolinase/acetone carboxylase beta subunit
MGTSVEQAALGIHRVLNAQMAEAMRLVSIGRGIDPRGYALLPLGGAGPIHAAALAVELGMRRIIVPPYPGVLSAAGLLAAPIEHEVSAAFPRTLAETDWPELVAALAALDIGCVRLMAGEGVAPDAISVRHFADVCYIGQGYHLEVPLREEEPEPLAALYRDFLTAHDRIYGYAAEAPTRFVNLRAVHRVALPAPAQAAPVPAPPAGSPKGHRSVLIDATAGFEAATVFDRAALAAKTCIAGPAIVEQADTTTLIPAGWCCRVAEAGHLLIEPTEPSC